MPFQSKHVNGPHKDRRLVNGAARQPAGELLSVILDINFSWLLCILLKISLIRSTLVRCRDTSEIDTHISTF